jgi:hypothetical protein
VTDNSYATNGSVSWSTKCTMEWGRACSTKKCSKPGKGPFQSVTGCSHLGITKHVCACPSVVVAF